MLCFEAFGRKHGQQKGLFELKKCTVSGLKRQFDKWHLFRAPTSPPAKWLLLGYRWPSARVKKASHWETPKKKVWKGVPGASRPRSQKKKSKKSWKLTIFQCFVRGLCKPNQRKGQNEKFTNFALFCEFWCFSLGKQARFTLNFCSGMPLRKVHELTSPPLILQKFWNLGDIGETREISGKFQGNSVAFSGAFGFSGNFGCLGLFRAIWGLKRLLRKYHLPRKHYPINSENFKSGNGNKK